MNYPRANVDGRKEPIHRIAYRRAFGNIPDGMHIHHMCENKHCQNPYHLQLVTPAEHMSLHMTGTKHSIKCKVAQIHPEHRVLKVWESAESARNSGLGSHIIEVCNGKRDTAFGCWWMYIK